MTAIPEEQYIAAISIDGVWYHDIVPRSQPIDLEKEDLFYADELEDGMVVIREAARRSHEDAESDSLPVTNRWCIIRKIRVDKDFNGADAMFFIGEYADGQKAVRHSSMADGWVVKMDSIPVHEPRKMMSTYICPQGCGQITTDVESPVCHVCDSTMGMVP